MQIIFWVALFFCIQTHLAAQTQAVDSLKDLLKKPQIDRVKIKIYNQIAHLSRNTNLADSKIYAEQAQELAESVKDKDGEAEALAILGLLYYRQGLHELAAEYYLRSLNIYEGLKNTKMIAYRYNDVANVYVEQELYDEALNFYQKSLETKQQLADKEGIATTLKNIANMYIFKDQHNEAKKYLNQALVYAKASNSYKLKADILTFYGEVFLSENNYAKAEQFFNQALTYRENIHDFFSLPRVYNGLGQLYMLRGEVQKAEKYFKSGITVAEKYNIRYELQKLLKNLAEVYRLENNYKTAYECEKRALLIKDTLVSKSNKERMTMMQAFFEAERQRSAIELLTKDHQIQEDQLAQQKLILWLIGLAVLFLLVLAVVLGISLRHKKHNEKLLQDQKKEIEKQHKILEEKNFDIMASIEYAKRIQQAILPLESQLREILPESFILFKPRDIVSGDFYWFAEVKSQQMEGRDKEYDLIGEKLSIRFSNEADDTQEENRHSAVIEKTTKAAFDPLLATNFYHLTPKVIVAAIDCTGHGVPGAFMSMIGNDLLNEIVREKNIHQPSLILAELHKGVRHVLRQEDTKNRDGMDAVVVCIDKQHEVVEFAGAMNPLYILRNEQSLVWHEQNYQPTATETPLPVFTEIKGDKLPIGGQVDLEERVYTNHIISLAIDQHHIPTTLYLCTDGYQDQFGGEKNKKFLVKRLRQYLKEIYTKTLPEQKWSLERKFEEWKGENGQTDDVLMIGIKV